MKTTCATAGGAHLTSDAAFVTRKAGALNRAAGITWAAHVTSSAAQALASTELLGPTADAVTRRAHWPIPAAAFDLSVTTIADDLVTFSITERVARFRAALAVLSPSVPIGITAPAPAVPTDNGPIAAAPSA